MVDKFDDGFGDEFSKWRKIVDTIYEGGMTDVPEVFIACKLVHRD